MINVVVSNFTGSLKEKGVLYPESGVIQIGSVFSHISHEKQLGKSVELDVPEPVKIVEPVKVEEEIKPKAKKKVK
jgi:hypothetical protein